MNDLLKLLDNYLQIEGFELVNEGADAFFIKSDEQRVLNFGLTFFGAKAVSSSYGIRFKGIEEIVDQFYNRKSNEFETTIFINTGSLFVNPEEYKFHIQHRHEVSLAFKNLVDIYRKHAKPYFSEYQTLNDISHLLIEIPYNPKRIRNAQYHNETLHGFFRGLVLSKIMYPERFEEAYEYQLNFLQQANYKTQNINRYMKFADFLKRLIL